MLGLQLRRGLAEKSLVGARRPTGENNLDPWNRRAQSGENVVMELKIEC